MSVFCSPFSCLPFLAPFILFIYFKFSSVTSDLKVFSSREIKLDMGDMVRSIDTVFINQVIYIGTLRYQTAATRIWTLDSGKKAALNSHFIQRLIFFRPGQKFFSIGIIRKLNQQTQNGLSRYKILVYSFLLHKLSMSIKLVTYLFQGLEVAFVCIFFHWKHESIKDIGGVFRFRVALRFAK